MRRLSWTLILLALAAALRVPGADPGTRVPALVTPQPCKNHYILEPRDCPPPLPEAWSATADMNFARSRHAAAALNDGRVLVVGGTPATARAEIYDPISETWTVTAPMGRVRDWGASAVLLRDGKVLVVGGEVYAINRTRFAFDMVPEVFDPATNTWAQVGSIIIPRIAPTLTPLDTGQVLMTGGLDEQDLTVTLAELFDPQTGTWSPAGHTAERYWHTATVLRDGRVLIAGGVVDDFWGVPTWSAEIFDPTTGSRTPAGALQIARANHTATLLPDGSVLVAGGWYRFLPGGDAEFGDVAEAERFDPATNAWTVVGSFGTHRNSNTTTLLRDGSLMVVGGIETLGAVPHLTYATLGSVEISRSGGLDWAQGATLRAPRLDHTATLLSNGSVLVTGGSSNPSASGFSLKSAEIYGIGAATQ